MRGVAVWVVALEPRLSDERATDDVVVAVASVVAVSFTTNEAVTVTVTVAVDAFCTENGDPLKRTGASLIGQRERRRRWKGEW